MMCKSLIIFASIIFLTACNDPPCPEQQAEKAAKAYAECLKLIQSGDGGWSCGVNAYKTFCVAHK